ncbi:MAG: hypothetical protein LPK45_06660 [Bacteroidota bacterium]|nr:hypothetical protein [Bacteroidota bacterium]MDX5430754.1 hypothetical protein [Bacteroidota bacterium]MDX5469499.1 hypothetical protein [Bacteroidota bacterium]
MKIRIKGDSVRIRLSKSEVDYFGQEGVYTSTTHFPNGSKFEYGLVVRHDLTQMDAEFSEKGIFLLVPQHWADEWVATQRVGFDSKVSLASGGELYLLLEKDFQCLDATTEDQTDMYPNPLAEQHK